MFNLKKCLIAKIIIVNDLSIRNNEYLSDVVSEYLQTEGKKYSDFVEEFYEDYTILESLLEKYLKKGIDSFELEKHKNYYVCSLYKIF